MEPPDPSKLPPLTTCTSINSLLNIERLNISLLGKDYLELKYKVIRHCKTSYLVSEMTKRFCENGGDRLQGIIPVSSSSGDMLFKNKHCAKCHGVVDVVYWNLYILPDCMHIINEPFANDMEREKAISKTCFLYANPPDNVFSQLVACYTPRFEPMVFTCNVTGQWDMYDHELETRCSSSSDYINSEYLYYPNYFRMRTFKNVYCYLCNMKRDDTREMCPSKENDIAKQYGVVKFSLLLKTKGIADGPVTSADVLCSQAKVFDPFLVSTNYSVPP